jgi:cysteine-S-conjugate beta-lyase
MHWRTRLLHTQAKIPQGFRSLVTPVYRGSTVLFDKQADTRSGWQQSDGYTYGLYGTPTTLELAARIAELEGAHHTFIVPGGQSAIALIYLAYCPAGSHVLLPWSAYSPNTALAHGLLKNLNIEVELYDPCIGHAITTLIRENTTLIWTESPGSVTMEVQDIPAITAAATAKAVPVALDNTYAAGILFDAFAHGVTISTQALTKYVGGHSDLLLGSVSAANKDAANRIGDTFQQLGLGVSPEDCSLALRGLLTLGVRLDRLERSTLEIARWFTTQPTVQTVLHPALSSCPGHEIWARDFTGAASIFSVIFDPRFKPAQINAFVDRLQLFGIGWSWGGVNSLAVAYPDLVRPEPNPAGRIVRFNIGLEEPADLIADLAASLNQLVA